MKTWLFFFIGVVALVIKCRSDEHTNINHAFMKRKHGFTSIQKMMIRYVAQKNGYDTKGWVDMTKLKSTPNNLKLKLQDQKVICIEGNRVANVSVIREQFITSVGSKAQFLLYLQYHDLDGDVVGLNPIPVIRDDYVAGEDGKKELFPPGFKGYLVCAEAGKEAFLVSDKMESVDFVDPEWEVNVDIQMFRNPLAPYGRVYKIIILDNVNVLKNGKRSFFWHVPLASIVDIYEFHLIMERLQKGKTCKVMRTMQTGELVLRCDRLSMTIAPKLLNRYAAIGLVAANIITLTSPLLIPSVVKYEVKGVPVQDIYNGFPATVTVKTPEQFASVPVLFGQDFHGVHITHAGTRWLVGNSIILSLWLAAHIIMNGAYYKSIKDNMKKMHEKMYKAPFVFPWRLEYIDEESFMETLNIK